MIAELLQLESEGALAAIDVELARTLARVSGEHDAHVLLAVALASRALREGHVCLPLAVQADRPLRDEQGEPTRVVCPALDMWLARLRASPLVGAAGCPLVLDERGRLYLARYDDHERALARQLARLGQRKLETPAVAEALLAQLFPQREAGADAQREAVLASRGRALSVIVGGPGTGKTSTVVRLLALLLADAQSSGRELPKILLTAPTGKAAQRLSEATGRALATLGLDAPLAQAIPTAALTLHRALKATPGANVRFQHDASNPIDCDILLLDEASMVDLALMRRLFDALKPEARVIMLGDPDQLAAVEAGGVLSDLCRAAQDPDGPLHGCVSRLERSYRYAPDSGVAELARAVHAQDADAALRVLQAGREDVSWCREPNLTRREAVLGELARKAYVNLRSGDRDQRLLSLDQFRVLCAHRRGVGGVTTLTPLLARAVHGTRAGADHFPGRPLLITQNDYASGLFNGDVGVEHLRRGTLYAYFRDETGNVRELSLSRLPPHESVYAMTVHKSQGSEFDHVALVLPEHSSPIVTRELLFTAVTRARRGVHLFGSEAVLRSALAQRSDRFSGLADRLRA